MMRRALLGALALTWPLSIAVALPANAACSVDAWGQASSCEEKLLWSYDAPSRQFQRGSHLSSGSANDLYVYKRVLACDENLEGTAPDQLECQRARDCDPILDTDGSTITGRKVIALRKLKTLPTGAPWDSERKAVCEYVGKTVPMRDVVAAVQRRLEKEVGRPTITAQPPNRVTLVNFVSLFSAPAQQVTSLSIDAPVPGTLTGSPEYHWDLDDGIVQRGTGHTYDADIDPKSEKSDGYYVKARYETRGRKDITLTLTWRVTMSLGGAGTVELDPIVFTTTDYTEAKEKRAVLVNN